MIDEGRRENLCSKGKDRSQRKERKNFKKENNKQIQKKRNFKKKHRKEKYPFEFRNK